ncbi:hypothetical protein TNCV_936651 [Trichonephila clavipes]|nr:hypothetical protein TNCV_936651 [Trichonephila clavipes]
MGYGRETNCSRFGPTKLRCRTEENSPRSLEPFEPTTHSSSHSNHKFRDSQDNILDRINSELFSFTTTQSDYLPLLSRSEIPHYSGDKDLAKGTYPPAVAFNEGAASDPVLNGGVWNSPLVG